MRKITVAVVGLSFGMEFVPIYRDHPGINKVYVCDFSKDLLETAKMRYDIPEECCTEEFESLLSNPEIDAIHIVNGIAVVDPEKCTSCGLCVKACPNALIEIIPAKARTKVACASKDFGKDVKSVCSTGCIGCKICEKQCPLPETAIVVTDNVAKIDYDRCVNCGKCAAKCPTKVIQFEPRKPKVAPKVEKPVEEKSATE